MAHGAEAQTRASRHIRTLLNGSTCALALLLLTAGPSLAEDAAAPAAKPAIDPALVENPGQYIQQKVQPNTLTPAGDPTFTTGLFSSSRSTLLGDAFGIRPLLGRYGITITASEVSEVFGNTTGGLRQGANYDGLTTATLQVDTLRAFGLVGGTFNASAFQIHGRNESFENLDALQTVSGIEANRSTRLWELWYDQSFNNGAYDIKIGQQSLDQEYITSSGSALFANTMMGWPLIPSYDLYAGGPAYPLSSLGVRIKGEIAPHTTALLGVFDDNPPGGPFNDDSQTRGIEAAGLRFNLKTGALVIGEVQYAWNQPSTGDLETQSSTGKLPGTYKLGFWYDTAKFPNQQFDTTGLSLADPNSNGTAANNRGNFSVYGVFDQVIYRPDPYDPKALSIFARIMGAPEDRNLISFSVNGGITLKAPFEGRDNDSVGLGFGVGKLSDGAQALDRATAFFNPGVLSPVRSVETFIEATYVYQIAPWWNLQPDFQYIFNPSGGIVNPNIPTQLVHDEAVFGLRTTINF
jgi:porin